MKSGGVLHQKIGQKIDKQRGPGAVSIISSLHIATFVALSTAMALMGVFPARTAGQAAKADSDLAGTWKGALGAGEAKLHIVLTITKTGDGTFSGKLNSVSHDLTRHRKNYTQCGA